MNIFHFAKKVMLLLIISCNLSFGQSINDDAIMKPINDLFKAMTANDSSQAAGVFTSDAMLHTVTENQTGGFTKSSITAAVIPASYARPKSETWYEPIWNPRIVQDGGFASVVVDYAFYRDKNFSHCGVDAFHLILSDSGWKIFSVTDTRRKEGCKIPDEIREKFEK